MKKLPRITVGQCTNYAYHLADGKFQYNSKIFWKEYYATVKIVEVFGKLKLVALGRGEKVL